MRIIRLPSLRHYWKTSQLYGVDLIKSIMTRDRFYQLLKFLHFADNEDLTADGNKLHKIENLLMHFNVNFKSLVKPGSEVVIDESMVPWQGRLSFKQYIKGKRYKYGVKLYKLCTINGYTLYIDIYTGKTSHKNDEKKNGHAHAIVLHLMQDYLNDGRTIR